MIKTNNNILRELEYTLKIINGEAAEVYIDGEENSDLNRNGYWKEFLETTDYITIPIISIDNLYKTQYLWYRNQSCVDEMDITIDNDFNNNIIEFINRKIKNASLDFDNLSQLIFIVEISYINDYGFITKTPLFVGRPEIKVNSTKILTFKVSALDSAISYAPFDTSVLESNTGNFYNFIDLKTAYSRIFNDPHDKDDDYAYPVVPFIIDEDTYLPDKTETILNEIDVGQADWDAYGEDYIVGDYNRKQVFYYMRSPECCIVDIKTSTDGSYLSTNTNYLRDWKFFTNNDDTFFQDNKLINENIHRTFRPIRSFIADNDIDFMEVGELQGNCFLSKRSASANYKIDSGDEIIIVEQLVELHKDEYSASIESLVFFQNSSNILYYNKTKDIMYWNPILTQICSTPFPKHFLEMRNEGYWNKNLVWNSFFNTKTVAERFVTFRRSFSFNPYLVQLKSAWEYYEEEDGEEVLTSITMRRRFYTLNTALTDDLQPVKSGEYNGFQYINSCINTDNIIGFYSNEAVILEPNDDGNARIDAQLDTLSITKPKNLIMTDDGYLEVIYRDKSTTTDINIVELATSWDFLYKKYDSLEYVDYIRYEYPYTSVPGEDDLASYDFTNDCGGNVCDFTKSLGFGDLIIDHNVLDYTNYTLNGTFNDKVTRLYPNISDSEDLDIDGSDFYRSPNMYSDSGTSYFFKNNSIFSYSGNSLPLGTLPYDGRLLDINTEEDRLMLIISNKLVYMKLSDSTILYESDYPIYTNYLLTCTRSSIIFYDTTNSTYIINQSSKISPVRLLGFSGSRYDAAVGLSNSFFKNVYTDNFGIKNIVNPVSKVLTLDDTMIQSLEVQSYDYNKLEYEKYNTIKNSFDDVNNDLADTQEEAEENYDESLSISMSSNKDCNLSVTIYRTTGGLDVSITNEFIDAGDLELTIYPSNYQSFEIDLIGTVLDGTVINVNFFDTNFAVGRTFRGNIEKQYLKVDSTKQDVSSINNKLIWKDDKSLTLKFPFLYDKYGSYFNTELSNYWTDEDYNIRKLMVATVVVDELLLFNKNYTLFNIGEQRVVIDSNRMYLNGYGLNHSTPIPYNDNRASFYIEKATYNFKEETTKLTLISV